MSSIALLRPTGKQKELLPVVDCNGTASKARGTFRSSLVTWFVQAGAYILVGLALGLLIAWTAQLNSPAAATLANSSAQRQVQPNRPTTAAANPLVAIFTSALNIIAASMASTSSNSTQHCVMAMAAGYSFHTIYVFIRSLRTHCADCQVVLFVDSTRLTADDHRHFQHFRIQLMYVDQIRPLYDDDALPSISADIFPAHYRWQLYFDYLRALLGDDQISTLHLKHHTHSTPNPITPDLIHQSRQRAYNTSTHYHDPYARPASLPHPTPSPDLPSSVTHVFFCDARDVIFQHDIFNFLPYRHQFAGDDLLWQWRHDPAVRPLPIKLPTVEGVWVFTEERMLVEEQHNLMWVTCAADLNIAQPGRPVLCSGATLASLRAAVTYLDAMVSTMLAYRECTAQYQGFDQGAHQIVVYGGMLDGLADVFIVPNARGPVATIALMNHPLRQTEYGQLLNERNEIYAVVHQYDRQVRHIKPQYERQYSMIAEGNLTWEY